MSKLNSSIILGLILCFSLGSLVISKTELLRANGVHDDVSIVLTPTRFLTEGGDLSNAGFATPALTIRDSEANKAPTMPKYSYNYIGPILFYLPFLQLFGAEGVDAFYYGQILSIVILIALFLFCKAPPNSFVPGLGILCLVFLYGLNESILDCPTQLQMYSILILAWRFRDNLCQKPLWLGALCAIAYQFRPESLVLLLALNFYTLLKSKDENNLAFVKTLKAQWQKPIISVVVFLATHALFLALRYSMGADSGADHLVYVLGSDILMPRNQMAANLTSYSLSDILNPNGIIALFGKIYNRFIQFLSFRHALTWRTETLFALAFFLLNLMMFNTQGTKQRRDTITISLFLVLTFALAAIGWNDQRYFDIVIIVIALYALDNFHSNKEKLQLNHQVLNTAFTIYLVTISLFNASTSFKIKERSNGEKYFKLVGHKLKQIIPKNARVLSNNCKVWNWYAAGDNCVYEGDLTVDPKLLNAYQPQALIHIGKPNTNQYSVGNLKPDLSLLQRGLQVVVFK